MSFRGLMSHFFLVLKNIPLSECSTVIHSPIKDISVVLRKVAALMNKAV